MPANGTLTGERMPSRLGRPMIHARVATFPLDDELVLYDQRTGEAHILNRTGAYIWQQCDGTHSITQLAQRMAAVFGIPRRQAVADIRELVTALDHANLVTIC
jgi:predicted RNase H-like nuclease